MNRYTSILSFFLALPVFALEQSDLTAPLVLSSQVPDFGQAYKTKLLSLGNGSLVAVYGDAVEDVAEHYVFDMRANAVRPARDVFFRACDAKKFDCSDPLNWSDAVNISRTATLSSINTDWNTDGIRTPYYGDSDNPHAYAAGSHVVVSWGDTYCTGGVQRTVTYLDFNSREIPMSCVHVAHSSGNIDDPASWTVNQLSDGSRDVKQDVSRGLSSGVWNIVWQEDPLGLQPGEAEGPGEGSSGAKVSGGTDIWYSYTTNVNTATGDIGVWKAPVRITDNQTGFGIEGSFNPVKDSAGVTVSPTLIDIGVAGASRANLALVGGSSPPKAVVAYEETKAASGLDKGKFLRYQTFNYNSPPSDLVCNPANYENCRVGCIVSNPAENARRARFVTQTNAGLNSDLRWVLFWREGIYNQGGPADIMLRLGYTDFSPENLLPAVDQPSCYAPDYNSAINLSSNAALNISSNTLTASSSSLLDGSGANSLENARAHRAVLRGDFLNVGYIYTPDWAVSENTDRENYNFFLRHFDAASGVWGAPVNLSQITDTSINVKEPRLMGPPGSRAGCANPLAPTDARDCQNINVVVAAWGTETNVYPDLAAAVPLDIYMTRSTDQTASFEPTIVLAGGPDQQGESQINISPSGTEIYAVWNQADVNGVVDAMYSQITAQPIPLQIVTVAPDDVFRGDEFTVTITVTNRLVTPDTGAVLTIAALPAEVTFVSASAGCTELSGVVTCDVGDLGVNASAAVTLKLKATALGTATIAASVVSDSDVTPEHRTANTNIIGESDIQLTSVNRTFLNTVALYNEVAYTFSVTNLGPDDATSVLFTAAISPQASLVSAIPDNGACTPSGAEVSCELGTLPVAGPAINVVVVMRAEIAGSVAQVKASAEAKQRDLDASNNTVTTLFLIKAPQSGGGFCSYQPNGKFDPVLPLMVLIGLIYLARRHRV